MLIKLDFQSELYEIYKNFKISFNITKDYNVQKRKACEFSTPFSFEENRLFAF